MSPLFVQSPCLAASAFAIGIPFDSRETEAAAMTPPMKFRRFIVLTLIYVKMLRSVLLVEGRLRSEAHPKNRRIVELNNPPIQSTTGRSVRTNRPARSEVFEVQSWCR
jgi:hypothetical protein